MKIGGNVSALVQVKTTTVNAIGEAVITWVDAMTILGWLDLSNGDSKHTNFNAKIEESTHYFLCDYKSLTGITIGDEQESTTVDVTSENARMIINGLVYEILLIDNPMGMNEHLEIYLRFIGGEQNVG